MFGVRNLIFLRGGTVDFSKLTLSEFLDKLGSKEATPGGGGAAALSGASAAGLVTMVARLTTGKLAFAAIEERLQLIIQTGDQIRAELLSMIAKDAEAFEAVMAVYAMPRTTDAEKSSRSAALQPALKGATESPLEIARRCAIVAEMAADLAEAGNPQTITDASTAAALAESALQGAIMQARINLKSIKDIEYLAEKRAEIVGLIKRAETARTRAISAANAKL
jgi:formiminotetrahydrofolate cyclodeaminase